MMIVVSTQYNSFAEDIMWNGAPPTYWSAVEIHLSIIACEFCSLGNSTLLGNAANKSFVGCLPVLRPVMRNVAGWFGHSLSSRRDTTNPSNGMKLSTIHRSQHHTKLTSNESSSNLAEPTKDVSRSYIDYAHGEETVTNIRASMDGHSDKSSKDGILVKYEVNLNFSGKRNDV